MEEVEVWRRLDVPPYSLAVRTGTVPLRCVMCLCAILCVLCGAVLCTVQHRLKSIYNLTPPDTC
jgi:hypothetical protein